MEGEDVPPPIESFAVSFNYLPLLPPHPFSVVGHEDTQQYNATSKEKQDHKAHTNSNTGYPYGASQSDAYFLKHLLTCTP